MSGQRFLIRLGATILVTAVVAVLLGLLGLTIFQERVRDYVEGELNGRLGRYEVRIGALEIRPLALAADMTDVVMRLKHFPERPVAVMPRVRLQVTGWRPFQGTLSGALGIENPTIRLTRSQARRLLAGAQANGLSVAEQQMWQDKILAMYHMILSLTLRNADVTYLDGKGSVPLHLGHLTFVAEPIQNVTSEEGQYPTRITIDGGVNDDGQVTAEGHLDLFARPHLAGKIDVSLQNVDLSRLLPLASRYHVRLYQGRLTTEGSVEYAPWSKVFELRELKLEQAFVNYVYEPHTSKSHMRAANKRVATIAEVAREPEIVIRIEHVSIVDSEFGIVHAGVDPPYRVFCNQLSAELRHFSNHLTEKATELQLKGALMGTGTLEARGVFRPDTTSPDFDVSVRLVGVQAKMLNDMLRAHGNMDVVSGELSVYAQFQVRNGGIRGYVKPLIKRLNVYDADQERGTGVFHKLYEGTLDAATSILENRQDEVGTMVQVSGEVRQAQVDTWEAASHLIKNAFLQVVLPRFERTVRQGDHAVVLGVD